MDVATLVKNITSAFEDASALVQRIRKRKENASPSETEPIDDLLDSLSLGPTVVRGYYESDARRFGSMYKTGDPLAREQLKDALINLQMTVLSNLGSVVLNDREPDYDAIQAASDDCRVNVGVCLGQLSQRMSKTVKGQNNAGRTPGHENGQAKSVQRSFSQSSNGLSAHTKPSAQSSGWPSATQMTPPDTDNEYLDDGSNTSQQRQRFTGRAPDLDVFDGMHSHSYTGLYSLQDAPTTIPIMYQKSSTMPSYKGLDSPVSPQDSLQPNPGRGRDSSVSNSTSSSRGNYRSTYQTHSGQEGLEHAETSTDNVDSYYYRNQQTTETLKPNSYSELTSATLGKGRVSQNLVPITRKRSVSSIHSNAMANSMQPYPRPSIPEEVEKEVYFPPPIPVRSMSRTGSYQRAPSSASTETAHQIQRPLSGPLTLPTDKNLLGFCKGAFRLQAGMEKKAFVVANRPVGYSGMLQYWKCDKCYFEGPCQTIIPPGGKKPEKRFDPTIREHGGIRYKWIFLAKCHVPLKTMPEGKRDGLYGSFGCLFCTAESAQRGWPAISNNVCGERESIKSTGSGSSTTKNTAVFGNIYGLMDHLQMHRYQDFRPGIEMQGRMRCVVGRVAQRGEDFDINFMPVV